MTFEQKKFEAALKDANELHGFYRQELENARRERDRYKAALKAIATGCYDPVAVEWARKALGES